MEISDTLLAIIDKLLANPILVIFLVSMGVVVYALHIVSNALKQKDSDKRHDT